jgi:cell division protein FtsI/penicillin-binding protein 2
VVIVDASSGRILSIVNQQVALGSAFQPCSTIKVSVALAALSEKIIQPETKLQLHGRKIDLTHALAHSSNAFFANLGEQLGYSRFSYYAHQFGYGERSGLNIANEAAGRFPSASPNNGGMGMMASFGEEISQTPLQLAALMSAVANGGTLYYLQYPRTPLEDCKFVPRIKRQLFMDRIASGIRPGLLGAVQFGTAHRARQEEPVAGKTGTCTAAHTHLGWFGSFSDVGGRTLAIVVLLRGGRAASAAQASVIAGNIYHELQKNSAVLLSSGIQPVAGLVNQNGRRLGCESSGEKKDQKLSWRWSCGASFLVLGILGTVVGAWLFHVFRACG